MIFGHLQHLLCEMSIWVFIVYNHQYIRIMIENKRCALEPLKSAFNLTPPYHFSIFSEDSSIYINQSTIINRQ